MVPKLFVYCNAFIIMALWTSSVVSLSYRTVYNGVSCARLESLLVAVLLSAAS